MLKITDINQLEARDLLKRNGFGHLGCARDDQPYVVPMHYCFDGESAYFFTTAGMKTEWLDINPQVCLQVDQIESERRWQSVVMIGRAERLTTAESIGRAAALLFEKHASLTPALNRKIVDNNEQTGQAVVYRIIPASITGRKTT